MYRAPGVQKLKGDYNMNILFKNGNIATMDEVLPRAEAMIVEDNKFKYVGTLEEAHEALKNMDYKEVDLGGKLVIPGFNDSHMHFLHYAKGLRSVNLVGTKSINEIKERMAAGISHRDSKDLSWIEGEGWNHDYFEDEKRFPNKFDLNEVSDKVPILVMRACFHIGVLNSLGLELMGINKETAPKFGDLVEVLPTGEPNGVIKERLFDDVKTKISTLNLEIMKDIIVAAEEKAWQHGLTSVQSDDIGYTPNYDYDLLFRGLNELEKEGKLKIRISEQCLLTDKHIVEQFFAKGYHYGWGTDKARVSCVKILSDGSLGARTAALRKPYKDDGFVKGIEMFTQEALNDLVLTSHKNNCPVAIHAIGDRAVEMTLDAIENAQRVFPGKNLRDSIVHCQITDEELLNRIRDLKVLTMVQPIFIDYDMNIVESRIGAELTESSYAWKTMIEKGIHTSFGTDCPVETFNTMQNIYTAVARKNITGKEKQVFLPKEKMSMEEALRAYTIEGAYASGEEKIKGSKTAGKLADFIVLDKDLFNLNSEEEILETRVLETYFDGELVYRV